MLSPAPESPNQLGHVMTSLLSYDGNVMLAAIISLLVVILFVLLLHLYAKWFLAEARRRRRRRSISALQVLSHTRFTQFNSFSFDTTLSSSPATGLDASIIASIPLFVYVSEKHNCGLECVICLSFFDEEDVGRILPKCGHAFHVECIDMWLHSHSNCPICRAPAAFDEKGKIVDLTVEEENSRDGRGALSGDLHLEIAIENSEAVIDEKDDSLSQSSSLGLGCSLKRMLSRSKSEKKVHPSSVVNDRGA